VLACPELRAEQAQASASKANNAEQLASSATKAVDGFKTHWGNSKKSVLK